MLPARSLVKLEDGKVQVQFQDEPSSLTGTLAHSVKSGLGFTTRFTWPVKLAAAYQRHNLVLVHGQADGRDLNGVIAVIPYYGDHRFLPWFLGHYRKLGVDYFVFLDLSSTGDLAQHVGTAADIAVWEIRNRLRISDALHALNHLRHRYARDKWCLSIDPYDLLVFPKSETRHLHDLADFMRYERQDHLFAIIIDAYGEQPARQLAPASFQSPLDYLPNYDRVGYETTMSQETNVANIQGGVQRRMLFAGQPMQAPPLNCVPLVKLKPDYYYTSGTRIMSAAHLNLAHAKFHTSVTACILRFALMTSSECLHIARLVEAARLYPDRVTPLYAGSEALASATMQSEASGYFSGSDDLVECGLLNVGQWF